MTPAKEVTLVFPGGGYAVVRLSPTDSDNLLSLVKSFGMPTSIRPTQWASKKLSTHESDKAFGNKMLIFALLQFAATLGLGYWFFFMS